MALYSLIVLRCHQEARTPSLLHSPWPSSLDASAL